MCAGFRGFRAELSRVRMIVEEHQDDCPDTLRVYECFRHFLQEQRRVADLNASLAVAVLRPPTLKDLATSLVLVRICAVLCAQPETGFRLVEISIAHVCFSQTLLQEDTPPMVELSAPEGLENVA